MRVQVTLFEVLLRSLYLCFAVEGSRNRTCTDLRTSRVKGSLVCVRRIVRDVNLEELDKAFQDLVEERDQKSNAKDATADVSASPDAAVKTKTATGIDLGCDQAFKKRVYGHLIVRAAMTLPDTNQRRLSLRSVDSD